MPASNVDPHARAVFDDAIVIDGLDVSDFSRPEVLEDLSAGGVTAINATAVVWEDFEQALENRATT